MIQITTGDMMHVHGGFAEKIDYTGRLTVRMKDAVDAGMLARALEVTQKRYPYLDVRIRKGADAYYYEENHAPVVLLNTNGRVSLNTEETNWHVWAVCYYEDYIHLDCYHGIMDGTGMYKVLATLLYYYCSERYGAAKDKGVFAAEDPILPEETQDVQETLPSIDLSEIPPASMAPAFTLETDGGLTPSDTASIWDVEIPEDRIMQFVEEYDSTPGTMVSLLCAKAINALYPGHGGGADSAAAASEAASAEAETAGSPGKDIISVYVINARPMLGAKNVMHNCLGMAVFDFEERIAHMPLLRQCTIYRGKTFAQSFDESIRSSTTISANNIRELTRSAPTLEDKREIFGKMFSGGEGFVSYLVSYIGKWPYPIIDGYITEFWVHPPNTFSLMVELGAAGGKIFLTIQQRFKEDTVREAFLEQLKEYGIPYKVRRVMENDVAHMPEPV